MLVMFRWLFVISTCILVATILCCRQERGGSSSLERELRGIKVGNISLKWLVPNTGEGGFKHIFATNNKQECLEVEQALRYADGPIGNRFEQVGLLSAGILVLADPDTGKERTIGINQLGFFLDNSSSMKKAFTCKPLAQFLQEEINKLKIKSDLYLPDGLFKGLSGSE